MSTNSEQSRPKKVTLVVFSADMDRAIAAFNIAVGAASMGMEAMMFFTFWGLNILKRRGAPSTSRGFIRRMLSAMSPKGPHNLPLSKLNMLGMGPMMMKKLMKKHSVPGVEEMLVLAKETGVKLVACTVTMELMGISKEALIDDVDSYAGVAAYLGEASQSDVTLFV
ncbi:MAG: DsrE/DsrF/DrsH-like family protein [Candidatus Eiseniibacteriota bacterium]|nr:MAG: DsrE/DsrF/DrsH-like family protein [Candidatus Eisenbacteria bacterium]